MAHTVNNLPAMEKAQVRSLSQEDPLEEEMTIHSWIVEILPGESHGRRSLAGYSPWGCKESDTTARLSDFTFTFHFHALEKEMATHSSVLAWRIPGMGEPGGLPSMGLHRVGYD